MWLTAFILGFTGSLHCAGMCSPLVMAVGRIRQPLVINRLLYNTGRILMYAILGALVSTFGSLAGFPQFQNSLSIAFGILCILMGIAGVPRLYIPLLTPMIQKISGIIKQLFTKTVERKSWMSISVLGVLNGLLPCGLTSLALTNCILLPTAQDGFIFMMIFGAGTLPVMLGLVTVIQNLAKRFNLSFSQMARYSLIGLGLLLISRSYFVHPHMAETETASEEIVDCR